MINYFKKIALQIFVICTFMLVFIFFIHAVYNGVHNPVINKPVATIELLKPVATLPIGNLFTPAYDYTTNASIIKHPYSNGYLIAFHTDVAPRTRSYHTNMHIAALDDYFNVVAHTKIRSLIPKNKGQQLQYSTLNMPQDPRLFFTGDKVYVFYNDAHYMLRREMHYAELNINEHNVSLVNERKLNVDVEESQDQKNWSPFLFNNELYLIYKIDPHIILKLERNTGDVAVAYTNAISFSSFWPLGELRGGTPAIYVAELNAYLTFFHSMLPYRAREPKEISHHRPFSRIYYTGAFLFEAQPPFKILAYTPTPLSFKDQYKHIDQNHNIIFPMGLFEEEEHFIISAGIQDYKTVLFSINKKDLYKQFVYLQNGELSAKKI